MNSNNQRDRRVSKFIFFAIGIIGPIVVFFFSNIASTVFPIDLIEAAIISVIIIVIGLACWLIVRAVLLRIKGFAIEDRKAGLPKEKEDVCCSVNDSVLCPLNVAINEYGFNPPQDETISEGDRLYDKNHVYNIEKNKEWKYIWIFSDDLSSEIDSQNGINEADPVVVKNITKKRTQYTFFYLNNDRHIIEIESRKNALINSLPAKDKSLLKFVPIDVSGGYIGKNTLPLLCGSILFSQYKRKKELPCFSEGYLTIRKKSRDAPVFYKMPQCMLMEYAIYFKNIINN